MGGLSLFWGTVGGGYILVADGLRMRVGDGGEGKEGCGDVLMSGNEGACVGSGGVSDRGCSRLPGVI